LALLGTGLLLLRRDPRVSPVAAVTAALLIVDAWFDVTTSSSGHALVIALAMALLVELPLCALCALIAARAGLRAPPAPDPFHTRRREPESAAAPTPRARRRSRTTRVIQRDLQPGSSGAADPELDPRF